MKVMQKNSGDLGCHYWELSNFTIGSNISSVLLWDCMYSFDDKLYNIKANLLRDVFQ